MIFEINNLIIDSFLGLVKVAPKRGIFDSIAVRIVLHLE